MTGWITEQVLVFCMGEKYIFLSGNGEKIVLHGYGASCLDLIPESGCF
jgi:hypothetical protein